MPLVISGSLCSLHFMKGSSDGKLCPEIDTSVEFRQVTVALFLHSREQVTKPQFYSITYHISHITYHISHITYHISNIYISHIYISHIYISHIYISHIYISHIYISHITYHISNIKYLHMK
ncbi:hypothetical protein Pelo_17015 [Pelomyxa schiedti]|nr:hypothetical protein Pelo_17015 [Pelomyxa schiedti]